jgi:putative salt-induced outer membrane protein YdiY
VPTPSPRQFVFCIVVLTVISLIAAPLLHADTVVLKNGDRLTGTAVKLDGGKLTFKTAYADAIAISWDQVTTLTTDKPLVLPTAKGKLDVTGVERTEGGLVVTTAAGSSTLAPAEVAVLRSAADQQAYEDSLHPGWGHAWAGAANVSLALAKGNSNTATFGAGLTAARATRTDKTSLYFNTLYSENANSSPSTSANQTGGGARYDHNINPRLFAFGSGDFLSNALQDLDLRSTLGAGFGWHASKTAKQTFDVTGGLAWTHENYASFYTPNATPPPANTFTAATVNSFAALDLGEQYTRKIGANSLFTEQATLYPDLSTLSDFQLTATSAFSTRLGKMFTWVTTFSDNYTSFPPAGTLDNDVVLTTGLGVTLNRR